MHKVKGYKHRHQTQYLTGCHCCEIKKHSAMRITKPTYSVFTEGILNYLFK